MNMLIEESVQPNVHTINMKHQIEVRVTRTLTEIFSQKCTFQTVAQMDAHGLIHKMVQPATRPS